jgi:hypothetical protein
MMGMHDSAPKPDDRLRAELGTWRMTEETIPPRPDDTEWRKAVALRLLPFAFLVLYLCLIPFMNLAVERVVGFVLLVAVEAVTEYARRRRSAR